MNEEGGFRAAFLFGLITGFYLAFKSSSQWQQSLKFVHGFECLVDCFVKFITGGLSLLERVIS